MRKHATPKITLELLKHLPTIGIDHIVVEDEYGDVISAHKYRRDAVDAGRMGGTFVVYFVNTDGSLIEIHS